MIAQRGWRAWAEVEWAGGADPTIITPLQQFRLNPWDPLFEHPEEQADRVCDGWDKLKLPDELCGVQTYWTFTRLTSPIGARDFGITPQSVAEHFRRCAVDPKDILDKCRRFHRRLRRKAALIYNDEESLLTTWEMPDASWVQAIMDDPEARRWMPASLDNATAASVLDFMANRNLTTAYNGFARDLVFRSVEQLFRSSGLLDNGARLIQALACRPTRPVYDYNGWEQAQRFVSSRTSNAQFYCSGGGQRYAGRTTPGVWCSMLDAIDYARACTDSATGHSLAPHLCTNADKAAEAKRSGDPAAIAQVYTDPWVFNHLLGHLSRTPQPSQPYRDLMLFNQYATPEREAQVQRQLLEHMQAKPAAVLFPVAMEAAWVTTGMFSSSLRDFQANVH